MSTLLLLKQRRPPELPSMGSGSRRYDTKAAFPEERPAPLWPRAWSCRRVLPLPWGRGRSDIPSRTPQYRSDEDRAPGILLQPFVPPFNVVSSVCDGTLRSQERWTAYTGTLPCCPI